MEARHPSFYRRVSSKDKTGDFTILRDLDQPFIFNLNQVNRRFRLEFRDTSGPESWQTQDPDLVILCYDISQRLSLINMKRFVCIFEFFSSFLPFFISLSYRFDSSPFPCSISSQPPPQKTRLLASVAYSPMKNKVDQRREKGL